MYGHDNKMNGAMGELFKEGVCWARATKSGQ